MREDTGKMAVQTGTKVVWFDDQACLSNQLAGGKGASLAAMTNAGLPVPPGFVVPASALKDALEAWGRTEEVRELLRSIDSDSAASSASHALQELVTSGPLDGRVAEQISAALERFDGATVAVRSSACAEDGDAASYAGQQETYLNVSGTEEVLERIVKCWGSFFAERALFYRRLKGSLTDLGMAVVVQRQLDPDKAGVMFTIDPVRHRRDQMMLEAAWGLGEAVVSGLVIPDHYIIGRDGAVKRFHVSTQTVKVVRRPDGGTEEVKLDDETASARVLDDDDIADLAILGRQVEEVFGAPQDVEWAIEAGQLYLLQSRPITTT